MKKIYNCLLLSFLILGACKKKIETYTPEFDVTVESKVFKVGEEVKFRFKGNSNQISFYSGEPLHDYSYKENRILETNGILASFRTNVTYNDQPNMLSVWLSTDFNGNYQYEDVVNATWKNNISQEFGIAPEDNPWGSQNNFPSGTIDLIEAIEEGKPLYIGFKYRNQTGTGVPRNWYVYNLNIDATTLLGSEKLFSSFNSFSLVFDNNFNSNALKTSSISSTGIYITFSTPVALRPTNTEVWAISSPIYLKQTQLGPDRPTPIKGFRNSMVQDYTHTYSAPGLYTATFLAINSSVSGSKEVIKQVEITITD